jgi:hypothetical protein
MRSNPSHRTVIALTVNAVILSLIFLAIISRDGRLLPGSIALGQYQSPAYQSPSGATPGSSTGSAGLTVMPGQLSPNTWGCYVIDPQNQTLGVYQFTPGEHLLRLAASRDIQYDRRLANFNTVPVPEEIRQMLDRQAEPSRAATTNP